MGELFEYKTGYASDYISELIPIIQGESVTCITADPGSGKTTMVTGCVDKKKMFKGLIDYFRRSVIVVPFNATNGLYEGPGVNVVASYNTNKYKKTGCNAMVIDQFNKHIVDIIADLPEVIFVDESHELHIGQDYRDSCTKCLDHLKNLMGMGVKIVFISATPAGEVKLFNACDSVIEIRREDHRVVRFEIIRTRNTLDCIVKDVNEFKNSEFDYMAVFSDRDCGLVFENGISRDVDITIYHSDFRENVNELIKTETLDHDVSCMTSIAYNGLNIRNTGRILIDYRYTFGESTLNEIIQIEGRFRQCEELTMRIYIDGKFEERGMDEFERDYNDSKVLEEYGAEEFSTPYYERLVVDGNYSALASVKSYKLNFTMRNVVGELMRRGFDVEFKEFQEEKRNGRSKPLKRKASDMFKDYIINGTELDCDDKYINKYIVGWTRRLNKLIALYGEEVRDAFQQRLMMKNKNGGLNSGNVESHLSCLEHALMIHGMSEQRWNEWRDIRGKLLKDQRVSLYLKKRIKETIKKNDELRERYKDWVFDDVLKDVIDAQFELMECYYEGNSKGGKNSAKKLYDTVNDCYYDSCKDASEKLGCGKNKITRMIEKGVLIEKQ